jgi:hypothetical protein
VDDRPTQLFLPKICKFQLTVTDTTGLTDTDNENIMVNPNELPPVNPPTTGGRNKPIISFFIIMIYDW